MGPALLAKFGSRGKIQLRCFQGRRASLLSQRHKVAPLIWSDQTLRNNVLADFLDREPGQWEPEGIRKLAGDCLYLNDEAGGKAGLTPASRLRLKTMQSGKGKSLTPLTDNLTRRIQPQGDHVIGESFICEEDDFGPDHITIR